MFKALHFQYFPLQIAKSLILLNDAGITNPTIREKAINGNSGYVFARALKNIKVVNGDIDENILSIFRDDLNVVQIEFLGKLGVLLSEAQALTASIQFLKAKIWPEHILSNILMNLEILKKATLLEKANALVIVKHFNDDYLSRFTNDIPAEYLARLNGLNLLNDNTRFLVEKLNLTHIHLVVHFLKEVRNKFSATELIEVLNELVSWTGTVGRYYMMNQKQPKSIDGITDMLKVMGEVDFSAYSSTNQLVEKMRAHIIECMAKIDETMLSTTSTTKNAITANLMSFKLGNAKQSDMAKNLNKENIKRFDK